MNSQVKTRHGTAEYRDREINFYAGGDPGTPTIVLVHGTGGDAARHYGILQPLLSGKHSTLSFDWIDPRDGELTVEQLVDQLECVIKAADVDGPITLVGYSLGAVVALVAAARLADQIENLVLIAGWIKTDNQQKLRNRIWRTLRDEGSAALAEYQTFCAFGAPFVQTKPWAIVQAAIDNAATGEFFDRQMDLNSRVDVASAVAHVSARSLVIACRFDQMVPVRHSKLLFGGLADARYVELDSGHAVVQERPAELFQLITDFTNASNRCPAGTVITRSAV